MSNVVVEGYLNAPFKAVVEDISKEEFDKLDESSKEKLIAKASKFKRGYYLHGATILFSHNEEEYSIDF